MRVRELAEEALDLVFQNGGSFLDDVLDVLEDDVLDLSGSERHNWHNRRCDFFGQVFDQLLTAHEIEISDNQLDAPEHHTGVDVGQTRQNPIHDLLGLFLRFGIIPAQIIQNEHLRPLHALVDGDQQSAQQNRVQFDVLSATES